MKITVKRNSEQPTVTIDTDGCHFPYAIREAIQLALEIEGFHKDTISEIFNQMPDCAIQPDNDK